MPTYGVQAAAFEPKINVGKLNSSGTAFAEKEEATGMVLRAVIEYVREHFDGSATIEFGDVILDITVTPKAEASA